MKFPDGVQGAWIRPPASGYLLGCCDCGLVHLLKFRTADGGVEFQVSRDEEATAQQRSLREPEARVLVDPVPPRPRDSSLRRAKIRALRERR